jgi:hypothetical protein
MFLEIARQGDLQALFQIVPTRLVGRDEPRGSQVVQCTNMSS